MNRVAGERPAPLEQTRSRVRIEFRATEGGLEVIDTSDRRRYSLGTSGSVDPRRCPTDPFLFPVDDARRLEVDEFTLPTVVAVLVRDEDGELLARTEHFAWQELPAGRYQLELSAPIKLHLVVESEVTISSDTQQTRIDFGEETEVLLGVQSKHEQPVATVRTPEDPEAMMAAISTFGSALKTTSPERSYPTFRGHPPAVERGESLSIPDGIEVPETGITLELPPEYRYCYVGSTLAYYLAARMEPGSTPRLVTDHGFEHPLGSGLGFEREVERVLKQTFLLDCVTRTEGLYPLSLHERAPVEALVDHDLDVLYEMPMAERLAAYLEVPFAEIEPFVPEWKLTTHVSPVASSIETLSYVVNDLAVIRTPQWRNVTDSEVVEAAIGSFLRDSFLRSTSASSSNQSFVELESTDSIEHAWVGEETPIGVSEATAEAYHNRFDRRPSAGSIDITVVCNDEEMDEERDLVDRAYGSRFKLPFDVEVRRGLTGDELAEQLGRETDLLHYIGHIDEEGFKCTDGMLDVDSLEHVGVDAFVLNACQSYDQGMRLIQKGAIGGIATLSTVINSGAVRIGSAVARLLNCGFPLRAALEIAKDESIIGGSYIVIGDGGLTIAQPESGTPYLCEIDGFDGDTCEATIRTYPTTAGGMGGVFMPLIHSNDRYFLNSGDINTFSLPMDELRDFLDLEDVPVKVDGELHWSNELDVEALLDDR